MRDAVVGLLCGLIFGSGLLVSDMMQPSKVLAFLDLFGSWDPSLAVVMAAALVVTWPGFAVARRREQPVLARNSFWPTASSIDRPLVIGSVLFGVGWGLVGLCPGPAIENLATGSASVFVFVLAMIGGMLLQRASHQRTNATSSVLATASDG